MTDHLYPPPTTTISAASSSPGERFQCSFCKADDGRRLVRGAVGVFICCECVVLAGNLFEEDEMDKRASVPRPMADRILFLDFDGVLNSDEWVARRRAEGGPCTVLSNAIDADAVARLQEIVEATQAKVVISSSWRELFSVAELVDILGRHGFRGQVVGKTPRLDALVPGTVRGHEIAAWLDCQTEWPAGFCILDDHSDMAHLLPWLVQTDPLVGLVRQDVARAVEVLQRPFEASRV